jgi:hypothetical protein
VFRKFSVIVMSVILRVGRMITEWQHTGNQHDTDHQFITQTNNCTTYILYSNNILYVVSTATCFDTTASSSGSLIQGLDNKLYKMNGTCIKMGQ